MKSVIFVLWVFWEVVSAADRQSLPFQCSHSADCQLIAGPNSHCARDGSCYCNRHFFNYKNKNCVPSGLLSSPCVLNSQCQYRVSNSHCNTNGICQCQEGFVAFRRHTCVTGSAVGEFCYSDNQCQLLDPASHCNFIIAGVFGRCKCQHEQLPDGTCQNKNVIATPYSGSSSSLGTSCSRSSECQRVDTNSMCVAGTCRCKQRRWLPLTPKARFADRICEQGKELVNLCPGGTFQCKSTGHCISRHFLCNGILDCPDGSDEQCTRGVCPKETYQCKTGECLAFSRLCDRVADCPNGEDEENCFGATCPPTTFRCSDGTCVPGFEFCNAIIACPDGSDEDPTVCRGEGSVCPFRCANGQCRSTEVLCTGKNGCGDNSDEQECHICKCGDTY